MNILNFYIGRANTDKTETLYGDILTHMRNGDPTYLIVSKQATFAAEARLSSMAGGGMLGVSVMSMEFLCDAILSNANNTLPYLSELGMSMTVRRIAELREKDLLAFAGVVHKQGFCSDVAEIVSLMKQSGITPDKLQEALEKLPERTLLKDKLHDIALLYKESSEYLASRFLSLDDRMKAAVQNLSSSFLAGAHVYFDELPEMTPRFYDFILSLLPVAADVTIGITDDPNGEDENIFGPVRRAREELSTKAKNAKAKVFYEYFNGFPKLVSDPDSPENSLFDSQRHNRAIKHLERNFFRYPYRILPEGTDHVQLIEASTIQTETDAVCDKLIGYVKNGMRFRDIAIAVSNPDAYRIVLKRSLELREIPYFLDEKKPALSYPAAELVLNALAAVTENFSPSELIQLAKSGYTGVTQEESEDFENYIIQYGIRSGRVIQPFKFGEQPASAESARTKLVPPLLKLREGLHGRTVNEKLTALYTYLTDIRLPEQLEKKASELIESGHPREAAEHAELWKLMMDLFDQLYIILGDTPMKRDDFFFLLQEGLSGVTMGAIPDTADRVLIGDTFRTILPDNIKVLFVIGANDGLLPKSVYDDSIINDGELDLLEKNGLKVWQRSSQASTYEIYRLYQLFSSPSTDLIMSYSQNFDGSEAAPSCFINRAKEMFGIPVQPADRISRDPVCLRTGLRVLSGAIRNDVKSGMRTGLTSFLLDYYKKEPAFFPVASEMEQSALGLISPSPLSGKIAEKLYGSTLELSATRLERFNQCPFRHFMQDGLHARVRPEAKEDALKIGNFYHTMLEAFINECKTQRINLKTITEEQTDMIFNDIAPIIISSHTIGNFEENDRVQATLFLMLENSRQSISALVEQCRSGMFEPMGAEIRFGNGCVFPAIPLDFGDGHTGMLSGIIDRVDSVSDGDIEYARVIDYKTNGKDFKYGEILAGISLQLPIYLNAVIGLSKISAGDLKKTLIPGGSYYMRITPEYGSSKDPVENTEEMVRLKGITVSDPFVVDSTDADLKGQSSIVKSLRRNADGTLKGNLCSSEQMEHLLRKAVQISEETGKSMFSGQIAVSPYESSCTFCDFKSVCRYDPRLGTCRKKKIRKVENDDFFRQI